jgi:hypothetical protein
MGVRGRKVRGYWSRGVGGNICRVAPAISVFTMAVNGAEKECKGMPY